MYQMLFRFPKELKEIVKQEADKKGQTLTGMMKQILWEWVNRNKINSQKKEVS